MKKQVAVVLSGCGFLDGSEIHEAVLALYFLDKKGFQVHCFAPNMPMHHVVNHITQQEMPEQRNVLVEAARIARGNISDLKTLQMHTMDALVLPGGYGAAKNLSDFAFQSSACTVHPEVQRVVCEAVKQHKPVLAICVAPAVVAKALQNAGVHASLTLGDASNMPPLTAMQHTAHPCDVDNICVDETHRIVCTPAYMHHTSIAHVALGIEQAVEKLIHWVF